MATTQNTYTGNGSTVLYSFTFPYLETTDIKVSLNGTVTTAYTLANATTIQFTTAPANGAAIRIYRQTDDSNLQSTFYPGSAIRSQDLNDNFNQTLYVTQETNNNSVYIDGSNAMVGDLNMGGNEILNIGPATVANSLVTKGYVDSYINTYYLGGSSSNPTTRPGGSPLQPGDYYVNTSSYQFRYFNGSLWRDVDYATEQDRIAAQAARAGAETAKTGSEVARAASETAQAGSVAARSAAETARAGAEAAQSGAVTAKGLADSARDAALLNANIYATTAAGLAATAVGGYFKTYSGNTGSFLDLYRVDAGPIATLVSTYPSRTFFSFFNVDSAYDDFYHAAWTDSADRLAFGIKPTGVVRIEKGDIGSLSVSSITAPGGSIDLDSVDTPLVNITEGGSLDGSATYDDFYALVEVDSLDRLTRAVKTDGSQYVPKASIDVATIGTLNVTTLNGPVSQYSAIQGAPGTFTVELVSGNYQIARYSNGIRTQLTSSGNNYAPFLTTESPQRVLYASTRRFATPTYEVMNSDGTEPGLAVPPKNLVVWGDSMTAFLAGGSWLANKLGDGRVIRFKGVGGQTSVQIAARQGGATVTGSVSGAQIPASGAVSITGMYPMPTTNQGGDGAFSINGIVGTLQYNGNSPIFTRSTAGSVVPVTNPVTIVPVLEETAGGVAYNLNEYTAVLWLGRNSVGGSFGETDVSVYTGVINKIRNLAKRIVILSIFNGTGETSGSSNYSAIAARNSAIQSAFPQYWYDIRADFVAQSKTWLQANYNSYYLSSWGSGDTDVANDVPPQALRLDGIHLNTYGNELLAELLAARITSLGW